MPAWLGDNVRSLLVFRGRDSRNLFWPYAGAVIVLALAVAIVTIQPEIGRAVIGVERFAADHPDEVTVSSSAGNYSIQFHSFHPELMANARYIVVALGLIAALIVILLAAAVVRRLHDRGRTGIWGLLPLPFLVLGLILMDGIFAGLGAGRQISIALVLALFGNNFIYVAVLLFLIWQLASPSVRATDPSKDTPSLGR